MAIARIATADLSNNGNTASPYSPTYNLSASANFLIAFIWADTQAGSDDITSVTWDQGGTNQAMTFLAKNTTGSGDRMVYVYYLLNPTTGNKTLRVVYGSTHYVGVLVAAYSGVNSVDTGVGTAPSEATTTANSGAMTITVGGSGTNWVAFMSENYNGGFNPAWASGTGCALQVEDAGFHLAGVFDSNGTVAAGSTTFNYARVSANGTHSFDSNVAISFSPSGGGFTAKFRKTLSPVGTGVGKRQSQGWN